jgi:hypothetical protein
VPEARERHARALARLGLPQRSPATGCTGLLAAGEADRLAAAEVAVAEHEGRP